MGVLMDLFFFSSTSPIRPENPWRDGRLCTLESPKPQLPNNLLLLNAFYIFVGYKQVAYFSDVPKSSSPHVESVSSS